MGLAPDELTVVRALELVDKAGPTGMSLEAFAADWRGAKGRAKGGRLGPDGTRGSLIGVSSFLSGLRDRGYLVRSGRRGRTRVALTRLGRETLERWREEFRAEQEAEPEPPW